MVLEILGRFVDFGEVKLTNKHKCDRIGVGRREFAGFFVVWG